MTPTKRGPVATRIAAKLQAALEPAHLAVIDESHRHEGHANWRPDGESHFRVEIAAEAFRGQSRLDRQRLVYGLLAEEMAGPVHALVLDLSLPEERR